VAEQFGRVIVEAQASGAVVAGYACGAIPEVAGDAAVVVPLGDAERLAESVARLVADPDEFAQRREAGTRQGAMRTWRAVAAQQLAVYRHACDGPVVIDFPSSPRRRRQIASAEFGATAWTPGGTRPFALPLLRQNGVVPRGLAALIDAAAELISQARS
jgi:hypothetical protein